MSDLISRENLEKAFRDKITTLEANYDPYVWGMKLALNMLHDAPTVDAIHAVHGEWIPKETMIEHPWAFNHYCSVCKSDANLLTPYCSNCGAKMDGGKKE